MEGGLWTQVGYINLMSNIKIELQETVHICVVYVCVVYVCMSACVGVHVERVLFRHSPPYW